ncbi:MAG: response regulator transcription factor [Deltaproteobacteria bacterium]|nr:response regulator transcription factor [Deltaproteobacteria bacterium]
MQRHRVMVIDDSLIVLKSVRTLLEASGFEVFTRSEAIGSGAEIVRERPDVVLVDVNMPLIEGPELVASLRRHPRLANTRVLLHSTRPEDELARLAKECGADGFVRKTAAAEVLPRRLRALLGGDLEPGTTPALPVLVSNTRPRAGGAL